MNLVVQYVSDGILTQLSAETSIIIIIIIIIIIAIDILLGGSSRYTGTDETNKNKYT